MPWPVRSLATRTPSQTEAVAPHTTSRGLISLPAQHSASTRTSRTRGLPWRYQASAASHRPAATPPAANSSFLNGTGARPSPSSSGGTDGPSSSANRTPGATTDALNTGGTSAVSHSHGNGGKDSDAAGTPHTESSATATASAAVAVSAATAAVVGAVAAATPAPPPHTTVARLLQRVVGLLRSHFLPVLLLYAAKDAAAFLLHRVTQRLTNHAAEVLLGTPTSTAGNPWWLYLDPGFIRSHPGYELLIGLFFLACLPFTIALNSAAFTTAALLCTPPVVRRQLAARSAAAGVTAGVAALPAVAPAKEPPRWDGPGHNGANGELHLPPDDPAAAALADLGIFALPSGAPPQLSRPRSPPEGSSLDASEAVSVAAATIGSSELSRLAGPGQGGAAEGAEAGAEPEGPLQALRSALRSIVEVLPEAGSMLRRVWWVDLQFNMRALPLQGLCLLVLPALWAVPRLLRLQLALPVAVLERRAGGDALGRSSSLMSQSLSAYGLPFAGLLGLGRLLEYVQGAALVLIPPRWWREVVEVPLLIAGLFLLFKATVHRLQDLLPLASYLELVQQEAEGARELLQLQPEAQQPRQHSLKQQGAGAKPVSGEQPKPQASTPLGS